MPAIVLAASALKQSYVRVSCRFVVTAEMFIEIPEIVGPLALSTEDHKLKKDKESRGNLSDEKYEDAVDAVCSYIALC